MLLDVDGEESLLQSSLDNIVLCPDVPCYLCAVDCLCRYRLPSESQPPAHFYDLLRFPEKACKQHPLLQESEETISLLIYWRFACGQNS